MITITKEFNFTANDFFNYLDKQLIYSIKKSRNNDMPVKLVSGIRYQQDDIETVIITYKRGEAYEASFKNSRMDVFISYHTQDTENGVKITFSEEIKNYDPASHGKFNNWLYNVQLKHGAKKELKQMADNVKESLLV